MDGNRGSTEATESGLLSAGWVAQMQVVQRLAWRSISAPAAASYFPVGGNLSSSSRPRASFCAAVPQPSGSSAPQDSARLRYLERSCQGGFWGGSLGEGNGVDYSGGYRGGHH
jgi:hypothetical protein